MSLTVDLYREGESWLHSADPRAKLILLGLFAVVVLSIQNIFILLTLWIVGLLVHRSIRTPWAGIARLLKALVPISVLMPLAWVLFYPGGEPLIRLWGAQLSLVSLLRGLAVVLRIHNITLAVLALLYATDHASLVRGLEKLRLPYRWGLVLSLALRYIPGLQDTFVSILQAQQARGLKYEDTRGLSRVRALMPVFIPVVITTLRDGERMGIALEARGFGPQVERLTPYQEIRFQRSDWAYLAIGVVATLTVLILVLKYGFATDSLRLLG